MTDSAVTTSPDTSRDRAHDRHPSCWLDRDFEPHHDPLPDDGRFDDLVVGAGLTGLTAALLLARAGRRVGVVEARYVGAVTTGRTTAKVSLLQGTKLSTMRGVQPAGAVRGYVEANREGMDWLRRFCADHGVDVQTRDAVTFAATGEEVAKVRAEHEAATAAGLPVSWTDRLEVPFPTYGATVLADQMQCDPMAVLEALVDQLRTHGGTLHEGRRVVAVSKAGRPRARLEDGTELVCDNLLLATGTPILDRGLHFAKVEPQRSYLLAFREADPPPLMCISAGDSRRSVRDVPGGATGDEPTLLVGGSGHPVGRAASESAHLDELREWAATHFPDAVETHAWSAQDYEPYSAIPIVGPILPGSSIRVATGFDKWGMAAAVAAARTLTADVLGGDGGAITGWTTPWRPGARALVRAASMNAGVAAALAGGLAGAEVRPAPADVPEGTATVGRDGVLPTGVAAVDGRSCRLRAICTHLGGVLRWNDAEASWDCPLHGSRFAADGSVLEGPATQPLRKA